MQKTFVLKVNERNLLEKLKYAPNPWARLFKWYALPSRGGYVNKNIPLTYYTHTQSYLLAIINELFPSIKRKHIFVTQAEKEMFLF